MTASRYAIAFTPAGVAYVRQVLGARPHDEVWMLIQSIDQQVREQDNPPPAPPPPAPAPAPGNGSEDFAAAPLQ